MLARIAGLVAAAGLGAVTFAAGCGGGGEQDQTSPAEPATERPAAEAAPAAAAGDGPRQAALEIFKTRCYTCHGMEGMGDGPGSAGLSPAPRNFQDPDWQAGVSDEHIANIIQYGGAAVGKSPTMPGNPDLMAKPEVVEALVAHIRSLGS